MCVVYDSNLLIWNEVMRCHIFLVFLMVCLTTIQSCTRLFCSLSRICIICEDDIKLGQLGISYFQTLAIVREGTVIHARACFIASARIYDLCARIYTPIFMKFFLLVS